jgi:hypothetical protein
VALTKLDVLTGMDPLRVCTAYRAGNERFETVPASVRVLDGAVPEYEEWAAPSARRQSRTMPGRRYKEKGFGACLSVYAEPRGFTSQREE